MKREVASIETLREHFNYDPETGIITKKKPLGRIDSEGYILIRFREKGYRAHRLAWALHYGEWPSREIDHINGIPDDNRLMNLRDVTPSENQQNKKVHREGKIAGVRYDSRSKRWGAELPRQVVGFTKKRDKRIYIGSFGTKEEAAAAIQAKALELEGV